MASVGRDLLPYPLPSLNLPLLPVSMVPLLQQHSASMPRTARGRRPPAYPSGVGEPGITREDFPGSQVKIKATLILEGLAGQAQMGRAKEALGCNQGLD